MSEMTGLEKDTEDRTRILSEMGTNLFVKAGAGSGKTTMLVNRMVAMVEHKIPIKKICAITFTKAAAGEFRERFQRLLMDRANPEYIWEDKGYAGQLPAPTDETRALCAEALENIDLCFMGTIDAFCYMVLSEHPSEARIPSGATLISGRDAEAFYKRQYVKICSGAYGPDLKRMANDFRALFQNDEEIFVMGESILMENRNAKFEYKKRSAADMDKEIAADKAKIVKAVECLATLAQANPNLQYSGKQESREAWGRLEKTKHNISGKWSADFLKVLDALDSFKDIRILTREMKNPKAELDGLFKPGGAKRQWLECSDYVKIDVPKKLKELQYSVAMTFLDACAPRLADAMREKGYMTFFDCLFYLQTMLKNDADKGGNLIRHIYDRHSYFLIDEFQDTNPLQAEIFFYLSSENPDRDWRACKPRPGALFIVGDPKQSIYRFRGADVDSFHRVNKLIEDYGGSTCSLSRNFRSTSTLCDYFNRVFTDMDLEDFKEIPVPAPKDDEFQGVFTYGSEESDSAQITEIIKKLAYNDAYLIRTGEDKAPRKIRYSDIMVITNAKYMLEPIVASLDEQGIPVWVEGDVPFGTNEALTEIYRIYSAVADGDDSAALYGALTGKLIGLTKEEILAYRGNGGWLSLRSTFDRESCGDAAACLVASKIEELRALYREARWLSPAALFAKILDEFQVYGTVKAEKLEVAYYALELLRNAEKSGAVSSPKDGAAYIARLLDGDAGEEKCLSLKEGRDAVRMANLHKVKGLEAPVVILAGGKFSRNSSDKRIVHGDNKPKGYLFELSKRNKYHDKVILLQTTAPHGEQQNEDNAADEERQRLVYVAATRARNILIICANGGHESAWAPIVEDGLPDFFEATRDVVPNAREERGRIEAAALYDEAEKTCSLKNRETENATYTVENPSRMRLTSKASREEETDQVTVPTDATEGDAGKEDASPRFPALFGTMTHKLMEMLVSSKGKADDEGAVREILGAYLTPETKPYEKELKEKLTAVAKQMRDRGYEQRNGLPQDILGTLLAAEKVYCEVPFCYAEDGQAGRILWNGVADVVYKAQGKWHIVDYKTDADNSDLDKKHEAQLSAYKKAFKEITGEDADARTYRINHLI